MNFNFEIFQNLLFYIYFIFLFLVSFYAGSFSGKKELLKKIKDKRRSRRKMACYDSNYKRFIKHYFVD